MKQRKQNLLVLVVLCLPAVLFGTARSSAQDSRQARLNHDLIRAALNAASEDVPYHNSETKRVISLLNQGADVNYRTELFIPWVNHTELYSPGMNPKPAVITPLLLAVHPPLKDLPSPSASALMMLVGAKPYHPENLPLVQALLDHKADVNCKDKSGGTPLYYAIKGQKQATVHLLLKYGADIRPESQGGKALLVDAMQSFPDSTDVLVEMLHRGADVNQNEGNGDTALFEAVYAQNVEAVRLLLSYHADVTLRAWKGFTPLALAKRELEEPIKKWDPAKAQQIIGLLQQAGAKE